MYFTKWIHVPTCCAAWQSMVHQNSMRWLIIEFWSCHFHALKALKEKMSCPGLKIDFGACCCNVCNPTMSSSLPLAANYSTNVSTNTQRQEFCKNEYDSYKHLMRMLPHLFDGDASYIKRKHTVPSSRLTRRKFDNHSPISSYRWVFLKQTQFQQNGA